MLSERERRTLARIERQLIASDPDLARLFSRPTIRGSEGTAPTFLLVIGLALLVFGSLAATVPIAVVGMTLSVVALFGSYAGPARLGRLGLT